MLHCNIQLTLELAMASKPLIFVASGIAVLIFGLVIDWFAVPKIVQMKIKEKLALEEGTEGYEMFKKFPMPLKFKVYIFHVENPDEVQQGAKPRVRERGPYVYDQHRRREQIRPFPDNDTLEYVMKKHFVFNKEESGCYSEEDEVTVVNAALVGTALTVDSIFPSALSTISDAVPFLFPNSPTIFHTVKVRQLLFEGLLIDCSSPDVDFVCQAIQGTAPETIRQSENGRDYLFSFFHHLNETDEGPYLISRGISSPNRGLIQRYFYQDVLDIWHGPTCNQVNGTDGTLQIPVELGAKAAEKIFAFSNDLCRSVYLDFDKEMEIEGVKVNRYHITERAFDTLEENDCFCPRGHDASFAPIIMCPPRGTMNLMPCMHAPSIFSHPHFLYGDRQLLNMVDGLQPDEEKHRMFAEIEPLTGTPVHGWKRAQMNLFLKPLPDVTIMNNLTKSVIPVIWLEEGAKLSPHLLQMLRQPYTAFCISAILKYVFIVISFLLILTGILLYMRSEHLACFSTNRVVHFNNGNERKDRVVEDRKESPISSSVMYPNLYPQIVNRNINFPNNNTIKSQNDDKFVM